MTKLIWDAVGEKVYETGVDRGVLYLADDTGVVWNGLTSVEQQVDGVTVTPYYLDGIKYYDDRTVSEFSAVLRAYTYPDEFFEFDGYQAPISGMFVDDQPVSKTFGLSYRTLVGNDVDGTSVDYKIHLLYNLTAVPSSKAYKSNGDSIEAMEFSWDVTGVPEVVTGFKPTVHVMFDTRFLAQSVVDALELILYGSVITTPRIPTIAELISTMPSLRFTVVDNGDGSWTATGSDANIQILEGGSSFEITADSAVVIDSTSYTLSTDT